MNSRRTADGRRSPLSSLSQISRRILKERGARAGLFHMDRQVRDLVAAGANPNALVPRAAGSDILQLIVLALLGHVH